jgi:hypothetical protein
MSVRRIFQHHTNKEFYIVVGACKIQTPQGEWVDGVLYEGMRASIHSGSSVPLARTLEEFKAKFIARTITAYEQHYRLRPRMLHSYKTVNSGYELLDWSGIRLHPDDTTPPTT